MTLNQILKQLFEELDRTHPGGHADLNLVLTPHRLPNFTTTSSGAIRYFTDTTVQLTQSVASTLRINDKQGSSTVDEEVYRKVVRESVAEIHSLLSSKGESWSDQNASQIKSDLKAEIAERLIGLTKQFKHYFPASTSGFGKHAAFVLGPVSLMNRELWLQQVDFSEKAKASYLNLPAENKRWKEAISSAMRSRDSSPDLQGLASAIWPAIKRHGYMIGVTIEGKDRVLSRRLAEIVCRTALDGLSLCFGDLGFFEHQVLASERLPPGLNYSIVETDGALWGPGSYAGREIRDLRDDVLESVCKDYTDYFTHLGKILSAVVTPSNATHPLLSQRWTTSLNWYAEGARESNSAIALAKFGSSLDVLASGGKANGITGMLENLLGCSRETEVVRGEKPRTLSALVAEVYESGRSQILHGTHIDQLKSFDEAKAYASQLARLALLVAAERLMTFTGSDEEDKAFRSM